MKRKIIISMMTIAFVFSSLLLNGCVSTKSTAKPNPSLADRYIEKGKVLERKGCLTEAHEQYKLALAVDPINILAAFLAKELSRKFSILADKHFKSAAKYLKENEIVMARIELLTALKYQPDHRKAYKMLITNRPDSFPSYVNHKIQKGETTDPIAKINDLDAPAATKKIAVPAANAPKDNQKKSRPASLITEKTILPDSKRDDLAFAYRDTGIELYNERKFEDAIVNLNKAVAALPDDRLNRIYLSRAYFESGKALFEQKDFETSGDAFEKSLQYYPQCAACEEYIEKARAAAVFAYRTNGIDYLNRNDFSSAIEQFEKYLQAKPDDTEGRNLLSKACFGKAQSDYNKGDFMAAMKGFKSALEYDSRCEKCVVYISQSLESHKETHYNKGLVYYTKQQLAQAVSEWEMLYELDPNYKDVEQKLQKARLMLENLEKIKKRRQS